MRFIILSFIGLFILGAIVGIIQEVYSYMGMFGPIVFLGVIFFFLSMAFKD